AVQEALDFVPVGVERYRDDVDGVFLRNGEESRQLGATGRAPGRPEVHERSAVHLTQLAPSAVARPQLERRHRLAFGPRRRRAERALTAPVGRAPPFDPEVRAREGGL